MTNEEAKSCICTIRTLQRLAYNIHGVMDVTDADNCKKIIEALEQQPSEWQQDHAILKAHADGANEVVDRVKEAREEIKDMQSHIQLKDKTTNEHWIFVDKFDVLAILDKLIAEVEG